MIEMPVTLTLGGPDVRHVVMELDGGGETLLTPEQARALADDLYALADDAETG